MKMSCRAILLLLAAATSAVEGGFLKFNADEVKNRPVSKVITLLKDMKEQLEKEAVEDEEVYDKMACWCTTNDKDKSQAIIDAEARITDLTAQIEDLTAQSSRLNQEIKQLEEEVAKNVASLDTATALRTKQLAEFNSEEKEMIQCVQSLKAAIVILSKHHPAPPAALLADAESVDDGALLPVDMIVKVKGIMRKHKDLLLDVITPTQRKLLSSLLQANAVPQYQAQSGEIFGILKQMKETFESDLSVSQKEELQNQAAYEELKSAKEAEIAAGQNAIETKTQELANVDEKNAQAKEDIEDTRNSLTADERFLMDLKEKCQMTDQEWEARQKTRQEEISAVAEAISILSADDAHDLFTKTFNPAFVQKNRIMKSDSRDAAAKLLSEIGSRLHNPRMTALATKVRLDAFTKVKKAIDDMVAELTKQKEDEIKHRDYCTDGLNQNEKSTTGSERDKSDVSMRIEDLAMSIEKLTKQIETLKAEIAELQTQMKRAGEDRELENKEFQGTVADQRATQKLLNQALSVLQGFYNKKSAMLTQTGKEEPAGPPPPPGFKGYKKNSGAGGVMGMIQQIINDAKIMEVEAIKDEEEAQKAYEGFVKETNRSVDEKSTGITNKQEDKAKAQGEKTAAEEEKAEVMLTLEQLANSGSDLHKSCDFVLKNFDIRQEARDQEIEALKQAKAILSGAKFEFLLQQ
jgi:peptidoglycan hydrolase CwlO-like protein